MAAIKNKRTKRLLLLWLSIVAVTCFILVFRRSDHSTVYKGKTIDQWLEECLKADTRDAAERALQEAGELALPDLVRAMTRKRSFFYKRVHPRLPAAVRRFVHQDKQLRLQQYAHGTLRIIPLSAEQIVPTLKKAIPDCDLDALKCMTSLLTIYAVRDNAAIHKVAEAVPQLRQALTEINDPSGRVAREIRFIEGLDQAKAHVESWVPLGTPLDDAKSVVEGHNFDWSLGTNIPPTGAEPIISLICIPRSVHAASGTNQALPFQFVLTVSSNKVSYVSVALYPSSK